MQASLIPIDGSSPIPINREFIIVGRKRGLCDVVIDHSSISKMHCAIAMTDGLLFIRDLGSTNGTKVNGQRIIRGALLPNDEIAFAKFRFKVSMGPGVNPPDPHDRTEVLLRLPENPKEQFKSETDTD